jgi:hypothetical protein
MAFWSALRRWGERAIDAGVFTVADIRNGDPAACTLPRATSAVPLGETALQRLASVVPRGESGDARQRAFERLLAQTIAARRRG